EYRKGREQPYGKLLDRALPEIFGRHPYAWSPIGDMDQLAQAQVPELQRFWETFYIPNNATLVVVGDVAHADVVALAEKYFGWIPRYPEPPRVTVVEPPASAPRKIKLQEDNGPAPIVALLWRTVPAADHDVLPLELLAQILGGGESSRLYRDLVTDKKVAMFALAGAFELEQDGVLAVGAVLPVLGGQPDQALAALRAHVDRVRRQPVTAAELDKAKNQALRNAVTTLATASSKAGALGSAAVIEHDPAEVNRKLAEIRALTAADLMRAAQKYLPAEREIEVNVEPSIMGFIKNQMNDKPAEQPLPPPAPATGSGKPGLVRPAGIPDKPPIAAATPARVKPAIAERTLASGLHVVVISDHEVPWITLRLTLDYGAFADPADRPGTAFLAAGMLTRGTGKHSYAELAEALDRKAIALGGSASMDALTVEASALIDHAGAAAGFLAEAVATPTFPAAELGDLVAQTRTGLAVQERTPEYAAERELRHRLYGGHPYERLPEGRSDDLGKVTADDLKKWWATYARPDAAVLYIAGDIDPERAFTLADQALGGWTASGPRPSIQLPAPAPVGKTRIFLIDRKSDQAQIRIGHVGPTLSDPAWPAIDVLSDAFGGGFDSRLNTRIRVQEGLTYGAGGGFSGQRFGGRFVVSTFSKNATVGKTVAAALDEIKHLKVSPPAGDERALAMDYLLGSFPVQRETPEAIADDLATLHLHGLPATWFDTYLAGVAATSDAAVAAAARRIIDPDHLAIIVIGDAATLKPQLTKIAPVELVKP
ncbi:MAG TPA: pitrilysin family protein, partial [Kofleriaceae bacterium]|nr:pitrilysin family protein [Kofleriaceae bacterium]